MDESIYWFLQAMEAIIGIGIGWIWYVYIYEPGKTVVDGLRDWIRESADDF